MFFRFFAERMNHAIMPGITEVRIKMDDGITGVRIGPGEIQRTGIMGLWGIPNGKEGQIVDTRRRLRYIIMDCGSRTRVFVRGDGKSMRPLFVIGKGKKQTIHALPNVQITNVGEES